MAESVGRLFVEIVSKGFSEVQSQATKLQTQLKSISKPVVPAIKLAPTAGAAPDMQGIKNSTTFVEGLRQSFSGLNETITKIGTTATSVFTKTAAGAVGLFAIASPRGWDDLQLAIYRVGIALGQIVIPIVKQATKLFNDFADFIFRLSDSTKDQIEAWVKWTLIVSGVTAVGYKVFQVVAGLTQVFMGLGKVLIGLAAASPLAFFFVLVAAVEGLRDGFKPLIDSIIEVGKAFLDKLQPAIDFVVLLFDEFIRLVDVAFNTLKPLFQIVEDSGVFTALGDAIKVVFDVLTELLPIIEAVGFAILAYKAAMIATSVVTAVYSAAMAMFTAATTAAAGGVAALKAALMSLMANPIALAIAAIATAVMALSGAFSNASSQMDSLINQAERLEQIQDRLSKGGKVSAKDLKELTGKQREVVKDYQKDPKGNSEALDKEIAKEREKERQIEVDNDMQIRLQKKLEDMRSLPFKLFGNRAAKRQEAIEEELGRKLTKEEQGKFRDISDKGGKISERSDKLSDEAIQEMIKTVGVGGKTAGGRATILERVKAGQIESDKKRETGELRPAKPELVNVADYYKRLLTAQQDDLNTRKQDELIKATGDVKDEIKKTNEILKGGEKPKPKGTALD